jgi:hypothetical protein
MDATERAREWLLAWSYHDPTERDVESLADLLQRVEREARLDEAKWWARWHPTPMKP